MNGLGGKTIAIIGGGPGGLTLARLLQQGGATVTVYKRDHSRSARVQGSALDLHENSGSPLWKRQVLWTHSGLIIGRT